MKADSTRKLATLFFLLLLVPVLPAYSQEGETSDESEEVVGLGTIVVEADVWAAQPAGLQYRPTSLFTPTDPFGTTLLKVNHGTTSPVRYRGGYDFRDNIGEFIVTYYGHEDDSARNFFDPSNFVFGQLATAPFHPGVFDDGLADAALAGTRTRLRDLRLDFYRDAFSNKRISGKWFVGYRRVRHDRLMEADYFALAAPLPALIPPLVSVNNLRDDLDPLPDSATIRSDFTGRGAEAGLEVTVPLRGRKLWLEAGFAVAVLRGKIDTEYTSRTHFYALVDAGSITEILEPPFDEFTELDPSGDPLYLDSIQQIAALAGVQSRSDSTSAQVLETYLGLRFKIWKGVEGKIGFRNARYTDVGADIRSAVVEQETDPFLDETTLDGVPVVRLNTVTVERMNRSVDYEGYYVGLAYRY